MPFYEQSTGDAGMRSPGLIPTPVAPEGSLWAAAARQENTIVSAYNYMNERSGLVYDPEHNPIDVIKDTKYEANYLSRFVDSRSAADTQARMMRIDREENDRRILDAGGIAGMAAQVAMGILDPTLLIPAGVIYKGVKVGRAVTKSALATGTATGAMVAGQETILYGTQELRTGMESTLNIATGAIVGGILGSAASYLTSRQLAKLTQNMDTFRKEVTAEIDGIPPVGGPRAAGAGVGATEGLTLRPAFGAEKALAPLSPVTRLQTSPFDTARAAIRDMADAGLAYKENAEGVPTAKEGTVETRVRMWRGPETVFYENLDDAYARYYFDKADPGFFERQTAGLRAGWASVRGTLGGKLTHDEFLTEVARAARRGEAHPVPHVAEAAKAFRALDEKLKKAAIEAKIPGFSDEMKVLGAKSHVWRMYNRDKIIAERHAPDKKSGFYDVLLENAKTKRAEAAKDYETKTGAAIGRLQEQLDDIELPITARQELRVRLGADLDKLRADNPHHVSMDEQLRELRSEAARERAAGRSEAARGLLDDVRARQAAAGPDYADFVKARNAIAERQTRLGRIDKKAPPNLKVDADSLRAGIENVKARGAPDLAGMDDSALDELVTEIINKILGESTKRIPGLSAVRGPRGPLAERVLDIADYKIEPFLNNNIEKIARATTQTMAGDIEIARAFGDVGMTETLAKLLDEFNAKTAAAGSKKVRVQLSNEYKAAKRDMEALRDRVRGIYGMPSDPDGKMYRAGKVALNLNYMRLMGGVSLSQLSDSGRPIFRYGMSAFSDGWTPLISDLSTFKMAAKEVRLAGTAVDMIRDQRALDMADLLDDLGRHSRFERGVQAATDKFSILNLMSPMTSGAKSVAGVIVMANGLRAIKAVAVGKPVKKQIDILAQAGIDQAMAKRIWSQTESTGSVVNRVHLPNTEAWTDSGAIQAFRALINRETETLIVTPGLEKPLGFPSLISEPMWRILMQFKTFAMTSTQRTTLAGLQQRDAAALQGVVAMMALGSLSAWSKAYMRGEDTSKWTPGKWTTEALDNSGILGVLAEANAVGEKFTGGRVGMSMISGKPVSRYASRNWMGSFMGPTFDAVSDLPAIARVGGAAFDGAFGTRPPNSQALTEADTTAIRKLIPMQNLVYLRHLFDKAKEGADSAMGIPKRRPRQ